MIYFPMINAPGCSGWNSINFFPPNDWENQVQDNLYLYLLYIHKGNWNSSLIQKSKKLSTIKITEDQVKSITNSENIKVFCLSSSELNSSSKKLFIPTFQSTSLPTWRAAIGIKNISNSSSYQGEIIAFKPASSFLTFAPFIQRHKDYIKNYFLFVNLESSAERRESEVVFSDIQYPNKIKTRIKVKNNFVNIIDLNKIDYENDSIPLLSCKDMAALPLFIAFNTKTNALSVEHTHPGASFVVHGQRWMAQNILKDLWFNKINSI